MKARQIREVIGGYRKLLQEAGIVPKLFPHDQVLTDDWSRLSLQHVHAMLTQIEAFVRQNQMAKAYRWLGFVQGVLWVSGIHSVGELKKHNS